MCVCVSVCVCEYMCFCMCMCIKYRKKWAQNSSCRTSVLFCVFQASLVSAAEDNDVHVKWHVSFGRPIMWKKQTVQ